MFCIWTANFSPSVESTINRIWPIIKVFTGIVNVQIGKVRISVTRFQSVFQPTLISSSLSPVWGAEIDETQVRRDAVGFAPDRL